MLLPDDRCAPQYRRGQERFCPIALTDWLQAAARARITHVAGRTAATFEREDLRNHEYHGPHQARLDQAFAEAAEHAGERTMMRWDCCANANLKMALSDGETTIPPAVRNGLPIDARLLTMLEDYPRTTLAAICRPWVNDALVSRRYPVEYRAYVQDGRLTGISSYYPQRPLRRVEHELTAVQEMTEALIGVVKPPFEWAARDGETLHIRHGLLGAMAQEHKIAGPDPDGIHFTADFLATEKGMTFLEGGPPWFLGAHPGCFEGREEVEGIALDKDEKPQPLTATERR